MPTYCPEHRSQKNRARDLARAKQRAEDAEAMVRAVQLQPPKPKPVEGSAAQALAAGLSVATDPAEAARIVGLDLTPEELVSLTDTARKHHQGIIDRRTTATAEIIQSTIILAALRLRNLVGTMGARDLSNMIRSLTQALDLYQGGTHAAYTHVEITWPGKPAVTVDTDAD